MEEISLEKPKGKVFTERQTQLAIFLGGPLAGGYIFAKNYSLFDNEKKVLYSWLISILTLGLILIISYFLKEKSKTANFIVPAISAAIATGFFKIDLDKLVNTHLEAGGEKQSWGKTILVGIISLITIFIAIVGFIYIQDPDFVEDGQLETQKKTYGLLNHEIYYFEDNITEKEIDELAFALKKTEYFDNQQQASVFARKEGNRITMSLVLFDSSDINPESLQYVNWLRNEVEQYISPLKFKIDLLDENQNLIKSIE